MNKVYKAHLLYTKEKDCFEVIENGYIAVGADGRVLSVSTHLPTEDAEVIDFGNRLLIPAMNDVHVHAPQYHNQGIAMDLELLPWLQNYTFPEEMKYADLDYAERRYRRFIRDLWRFGTMRACVFATIHTESTRLLMRLFQEAGMGALVGKVAMNRNCPEGLSESVEDMAQGYESLIGDFSHDSHVRPIITPRFIPSCSPEMLRACGDLAAKYQLPVQSHLSENKDEIALVAQLEPESTCYGDAYNRYGLFGQTPTVMAHCVWTEGEELELMKKNGVMVAHCPTSNLNIASGLIQVSKLCYQQNHDRKFLSLSEAFWIATKSAGSFFGRVGSFEPGYEFDALVINDSDLNHDDYSLLHRLERFIYLGDDRQIEHRFCCGKEVF